MAQHRSTPSMTSLRLNLDFLPLPSSQSGYQSLKSPSFYKPRKSYDPYAGRRRRKLVKFFAWAALLIVGILGVWAWRVAATNERVAVEQFGSYAMEAGAFPPDKHHPHHHNTHKHRPQPPSQSTNHRPILTNPQKLAALTSFILSPLHGNSLPFHSPQSDVHVEDLLEFNLDNERAGDMISEMVRDTWEGEKVVVFGKRHHPETRRLLALLKSREIPQPEVVELDKRDDGVVLEDLLRELVPSSEVDWALPLLILKGTPIVGLEKIKATDFDTIWGPVVHI